MDEPATQTEIGCKRIDPENEPQWFKHNNCVWGRWNIGAAILYVMGVVIPLICYMKDVKFLPCSATSSGISSCQVLYGIVISVAPVAWFWIQSIKFEQWVRHLGSSDQTQLPIELTKVPVEDYVVQRAIERAYYKIITDYALRFWVSIIAVYAALMIRR